MPWHLLGPVTCSTHGAVQMPVDESDPFAQICASLVHVALLRLFFCSQKKALPPSLAALTDNTHSCLQCPHRELDVCEKVTIAEQTGCVSLKIFFAAEDLQPHDTSSWTAPCSNRFESFLWCAFSSPSHGMP